MPPQFTEAFFCKLFYLFSTFGTPSCYIVIFYELVRYLLHSSFSMYN
jgi:hypothetical protein